jgi:hypothetical protein
MLMMMIIIIIMIFMNESFNDFHEFNFLINYIPIYMF